MDWPAEVIAVFRKGLTFTPNGDLKRDDLLIWVFEETARRAVWRAKGNPTDLSPALRTPFTPLGSVVPGALMSYADSICIHGADWGAAVDALYGYLEQNAEAVCAAFADEKEEYDSDVGFGF